jgi:hypothetical protein
VNYIRPCVFSGFGHRKVHLSGHGRLSSQVTNMSRRLFKVYSRQSLLIHDAPIPLADYGVVSGSEVTLVPDLHSGSTGNFKNLRRSSTPMKQSECESRSLHNSGFCHSDWTTLSRRGPHSTIRRAGHRQPGRPLQRDPQRREGSIQLPRLILRLPTLCGLRLHRLP